VNLNEKTHIEEVINYGVEWKGVPWIELKGCIRWVLVYRLHSVPGTAHAKENCFNRL
jgi:hypothetical protein